MKKLLSIILAMALSVSLAAPTFAYDTIESSPVQVTDTGIVIDMQYYENLNDIQLKQEFLKMGFSEQDADTLIVLKNVDLCKEQSKMSTRAFPSNPSIGTTYTQVVKVSVKTVSTISDVYSALTAASVPSFVASIIAGRIFNLIMENVGINGVKVTIEYYYGPDNDGEIRWNYRRVWCDLY